ncbi:MAG: hypothetical protein ACFFAZ_02090 [Promethearchaeota archaeon]
MTAEGDNGCIRVELPETHKGEYRGLASTGKTDGMTAVPSYRIVDGGDIIT